MKYVKFRHDTAEVENGLICNNFVSDSYWLV